MHDTMTDLEIREWAKMAALRFDLELERIRLRSLRRALAWCAGYASVVTVALVWRW